MTGKFPAFFNRNKSASTYAIFKRQMQRPGAFVDGSVRIMKRSAVFP